MSTKGANLNYEQKLFINGIPVSGVTNIDGSYEISEEPINIIGKGYAYPVRQGPLVGNFNVSKYYIGKEQFLDYVGSTPIDGSIHYGDKNFGFTQGYLSEYSFSAGIGQIPQANASITVHGDIGRSLDNSQSPQPHPKIEIINQGSIELNVAGYTSNRVTNFSYTIRINRTPLYAIGSPFPVQVDTSFPIIQQSSFSIDANDYEIERIREFLVKPKQQDIILTLKNPINNSPIENFEIKNARLSSHVINSSSSDLLSIDFTYDGYINRLDRQY